MTFRVGNLYRGPLGLTWRLDFITERDECVFYIPEKRMTSLPIPTCLCQAFLEAVEEAEAS